MKEKKSQYLVLITLCFWSISTNISIAQNSNHTPVIEPDNKIENIDDLDNTEDDRPIFDDNNSDDNNDENSKYIGLKYQQVPQGLTGLGGWVIGDAFAPTIFGISRIQRIDRQMLWLEIITNDPDGKPRYEVLDVLELPQLETNDEVTTYCRLQGKLDPEIVTIAVYEDTEFLTNIKQAWRANRQTGKFEVLSIEGLDCINSGYGV